VIGEYLAWTVAAACALIAAAVFVWQRTRLSRAFSRARNAERTLVLLGQIAPVLTDASTESVSLTCERIVQRLGMLVPTETILCLVVSGGRLVLGAKSDSGYAGFLKIGDPCEGDSIVDWVAQHARPAVIGPTTNTYVAARVYSRSEFADLTTDPTSARSAAPLVGSRDRVWALCIPMLQERGHGLRPKFLGAVYAERPHDAPFIEDELRSASLVAHIAGDALLRAQFADEVKRESEIDQLTQLLSATIFRKRLRQEIETRRYPSSHDRSDVALFFIDTDKFKLWNDTFGHVVGDMVLKRLAELFQQVAASGGFAGRNGGDEFCIALLDRTKDDAIEVAERLRVRVERTDLGASADGTPSPRIPVTISVGVAHFPVDVAMTAEAPADLLLEAADARMYEAKRAGGNKVAYSRTRALPTKLRYPGEGPIPRR
jgi:diguanylate cyclase (GGDEF)-like protein